MKKLFHLFSRRRIDRSQRIRLLLSDGVRLETEDEVYPVLNLSESGLGLLADKASPPDELAGQLILGDESLPVKIAVARRTGSHVGARFLGDLSPLRAALRRQFTEEIRATEMSEVGAGRLADNAEPESGQPRWFYAPDHYELFFLESESGINRIEIEWNGRVVMVGSKGPLRTGVIDQVEREGPAHASSSLVRWESGEVADRFRAKAIRIVENIPGLDPLTRGKLVRRLRNAD